MTEEKAKYFSEVLKAYSEGKQIQSRVFISTGWSDWENLISNPIFYDNPNIEYRIKPEQKLRPYANAEEFLKAQKEHGPYITWKDSSNVYLFPTGITDDAISGDAFNLLYSILITGEYIWQDKTPCGILEN